MTIGSFQSWQSAFFDSVQEPSSNERLKVASLAADLRSWTSELTHVAVRSCQAVGWVAAARGNPCERMPQVGQEYLGIDVMAFPASPGMDRWPTPTAVFELENHHTDDRVAYSLWKVLCIRASLRVVFAFRRDWEASRQTVSSVGRDVVGCMLPQERMALAGQTVLAIGNRGEGETFPWGFFKWWLLDTNVGRFEKV